MIIKYSKRITSGIRNDLIFFVPFINNLYIFWKKKFFLTKISYFFALSKSRKKIILRRSQNHSNWVINNTSSFLRYNQLPSILISIIVLKVNYFLFLFFSTSSNLIFSFKTSIMRHNYLFSYSIHSKIFALPQRFFLYYRTCIGYLATNSFLINIIDWSESYSKFSRSFNSYSKLLYFDTVSGFCLIQLPSKKTKAFYFLTTAFTMNKLTSLIITQISNKAGFYHKLGFKPIVRGIAKNPIDHPHGGRTKSIKLARTPWGLITKYK